MTLDVDFNIVDVASAQAPQAPQAAQPAYGDQFPMTQEQFLMTRSSRTTDTIPDMHDEEGMYSDYVPVNILGVGFAQATKVETIVDAKGRTKKVRVPLLDAEGNPAMTVRKPNKTFTVALSGVGEHHGMSTTWQDVQATGLNVFISLIAGAIGQGMAKRGLQYMPNEVLMLKDVYDFFDVHSTDELARTLLPKLIAEPPEAGTEAVPKPRSRKNASAANMCDLGDVEKAALFDWLYDKAAGSILLTASIGNSESSFAKKVPVLRKVIAYAIKYATTGEMRGAKPTLARVEWLITTVKATLRRLSRQLDHYTEVTRSGTALDESEQAKFANLPLAVASVTHLVCRLEDMQTEIIEHNAALAAKAAKSNPGKSDAPNMFSDAL